MAGTYYGPPTGAKGLAVYDAFEYDTHGHNVTTGKDIRVTYGDGSFTDVWSEGRQGVRATYSSGTYEDILWEKYDRDWLNYLFMFTVSPDTDPVHSSDWIPGSGYIFSWGYDFQQTKYSPDFGEPIAYAEARAYFPDIPLPVEAPWAPHGEASHIERWVEGLWWAPSVGYAEAASFSVAIEGNRLRCDLAWSGWAASGYYYTLWLEVRVVLESGAAIEFLGAAHLDCEHQP